MSSESFARIGFGRINGSSGNVRSHTFELDSKRFFFVCILFAQVNCAQLILIGCERFKFEFRFGFKFGSKLAERCNEPMQIRLMAGTQQASLWCVLSGSLLKKSISDIGNNDYYYYYYSLARSLALVGGCATNLLLLLARIDLELSSKFEFEF